MAEFRLLIVPEEGMPYFPKGMSYGGRSVAILAADGMIKRKEAKAIIVYRDKKPTQLLVHRPSTYVHIERI